MFATVKILVKGYINENASTYSEKEVARPTITLVRDGKWVIVVDPGTLENNQVLTDALEKENLTVDDVNIVCITHSHFDHYKNVGMFPNAKVLERFGLWDNDKLESCPQDFTKNIKIVPTPGHDSTSITLFVTTGPESEFPGIVAICGDVFWREGYPENSYNDSHVQDGDKLEESRRMVLSGANWIVPGHGDIYSNNMASATLEIPVPILKIKEVLTPKCKKCGQELKKNEKCKCRPTLCYRCCECEMECHNCSCSHRVFKGKK